MHKVKMPVDFRTVIEIFESQKIEMVSANFLCTGNDVSSLRWETLGKDFADRPSFGRREEKTTAPRTISRHLACESCPRR